jgi:hypothetical protein
MCFSAGFSPFNGFLSVKGVKIMEEADKAKAYKAGEAEKDEEGIPPECAPEIMVKTLATGMLLGGFFGFLASLLAALGLMGTNPALMLIMAILALGLAAMESAATVSGRMHCLRSYLRDSRVDLWKLGSRTANVRIGAAFGILLALLAGLGVSPAVLAPVAIIILGVALTVITGVLSRVNTLWMEVTSPLFVRLTAYMVTATAFIQNVACLAAVVLSIMDLSGVKMAMLNLIAVLALGIAKFIIGAALTTRMIGSGRHV